MWQYKMLHNNTLLWLLIVLLSSEEEKKAVNEPKSVSIIDLCNTVIIWNTHVSGSNYLHVLKSDYVRVYGRQNLFVVLYMG